MTNVKERIRTNTRGVGWMRVRCSACDELKDLYEFERVSTDREKCICEECFDKKEKKK